MGFGNLLQKILTSPLPLTSSPCSPSALPYPSLFGAEFLSLTASVVSNYSRYVHEGYYLNHGSINVTNARFCNVTLAYTHPGQHDLINVQAWLPLGNDNDTWNERLQAVGGGGWMAGMFVLSEMEMTGAIGEGYATITTDGGHAAQDPNDWALVSPGNVDLYALQNFASVSLNDVAVIGKSLVRSFYGRPPKYSYWSGCSQGGRQGLMLAQRYPTAFDGIVASAPAINFGEFVVGNLWPQVVMDMIRQYPHACLLDALTAAAIEACDGDDGLVDGVISDPEACFFDPFTLVGTTVKCGGDDDDDAGAHDNNDDDVQITVAAAAVANAAWSGAVTSSSGKPLWHGVGYDAILTGPTGVANTECDKNGTCVGAPSASALDWVKLFIRKDPWFALGDLTHQEFERYFHATAREFGSIIDTNDPDLSDFRRAGGKMLTYHGLADGLIPPKSTRAYYEAVSALDPDVHDFYRLFESPGLGHCWGGGRGGYPSTAFDSMVAWVESGIAPTNLTVRFRDASDVMNQRFLCPYPQKARYDGHGDPTVAASFYCSV